MTPEMKAEIIRLCEEDDLSVRVIGERVGVAASTVSRVARAAGIKFSEERLAQTREATATRLRRVREDRLDLAERLLADAFRTRARMWAEHKFYERGPEGLVLVTLPTPSIKEQRDGYHTIQAQVDAHDKLMGGIEYDDDDNRKNLMTDIMDSLAEFKDTLGSGPKKTGPKGGDE